MWKKENRPSIGLVAIIAMLISISGLFFGEKQIEVNLDDTLIKTEKFFTKLCDFDLPAYSKFSENRVAVANLANLVSSNNAFDTSEKNIYDDLQQLETNYLNQLSTKLELIYEEGNKFFLTFEKSYSEWEKLIIMNRYDPELFELMKNQTIYFYSVLYDTAKIMDDLEKFTPSTKPDSEDNNENKEMVLSQWINRLNIGLWCNTSIIKKCELELSRIKKILEFLENSKLDLNLALTHISRYAYDLDTFIEVLSKENIQMNHQVTKNLKHVINVIKFCYMKFLTNQDIQKNSEPKDNKSLDLIKEIKLISEQNIHKSELIGELGCRGEFVTYFSNSPIFQETSMAKQLPFLQNIKTQVDSYHVDSLTFEWSDNISFKYGGNDGNITNSFNIGKDEVVSWIKIYKYSGGKVSGFELRTSEWRTTGTLGNPINPTILKAPRGYEIVGLYGSFDKYICGIGILYSKFKDIYIN